MESIENEILSVKALIKLQTDNVSNLRNKITKSLETHFASTNEPFGSIDL